MNTTLYLTRSMLPRGWFALIPRLAVGDRWFVLNDEAYPPGVPTGTPLRLTYVADHNVGGVIQREIVLAVKGRRAVIVYVGSVGGRGSVQIIAELEGMRWVWRRIAFEHDFAGQRQAKRVWWQNTIDAEV